MRRFLTFLLAVCLAACSVALPASNPTAQRHAGDWLFVYAAALGRSGIIREIDPDRQRSEWPRHYQH